MKKVLLLTLFFMMILTGCFDTSTGVGKGSTSDNLEITNFTVDNNTNEAGDIIPSEGSASSTATIGGTTVLIPIEKFVIIAFNEGIAVDTVNATSVYILDNNQQPISAELIVEGNQIYIVPSEFFLPDTHYTIVVTTNVRDISGRTLENLFRFTFTTVADENILDDETAPELRYILPASGSSVDATINIVMGFSESIAGTGFLQVRENGSNTIVSGTNTKTDTELGFIPHQNLTPGSTYTVTLFNSIEDISGDVYTGLRSWSFSIAPVAITPPPVNPPVNPPVTPPGNPPVDTVAPTLISAIPIDGSTVTTTTAIRMSFNESIAGTGVLNLRDVTSSSDVDGVSNINGNSLEFTPTTALVSGHNYTVTLENTVEDLSGNEYTGQTNWVFSVASAPPPVDTTAPTWVSFTPAEGASVDGTTAIIMTFNEDIQNTGETLRVTNNMTHATVDGTSGVSANTLWFIPDNPLPADNYTVTVQGITSDTTGNEYNGQSSWSFDVNAPASLSIESIVGQNKQIDIRFSEALDTSTVSIGDFTINGGAITINSINFTTGDTIVKIHADEVIPSGTVLNISGNIADVFGALHNSGVDADYILL